MFHEPSKFKLSSPLLDIVRCAGNSEAGSQDRCVLFSLCMEKVIKIRKFRPLSVRLLYFVLLSADALTAKSLLQGLFLNNAIDYVLGRLSPDGNIIPTILERV